MCEREREREREREKKERRDWQTGTNVRMTKGLLTVKSTPEKKTKKERKNIQGKTMKQRGRGVAYTSTVNVSGELAGPLEMANLKGTRVSRND